MSNLTLRFIFTGSLWLLANLAGKAQEHTLPPVKRCETMEALNKTIQNNPGIVNQWRAEGERWYKAYQRRQASGNRVAAGPIIIPIVFHIIDSAARQAWVTDRDIYEQVEILNRDYSGQKADLFKSVIPIEITNRVGRIPVKFVLARRAPDGSLSSGIERRVGASPDHISIKSTAAGGLDAWDSSRYVNVWCGTFSGAEDGLLGIATFPFSSDQGGQGVVIGTVTLPYTSPVSRSYYPTYTEGATLSHEIGHYFYLWHTFGDNAACNNNDFRIQSGWPLAPGAGPEGDDTPEQKGDPSKNGFVYGNPSQNYNVGCSPVTYGIVYGSFMNYFDDRALFMFTNGHRKRVESCIDLYRPGLKTSNGAVPPVPVTDAFLVTVNPRGTPERRIQFANNTPLTAVVRNTGTSNLNTVTITLQVDGGAPATTVFPLALQPGNDTSLNLGPLTASAANHNLLVYCSSPNGSTDNFLNNDTLQSFVTINGGTVTAPFTENFSSTSFPPANWSLWNPNGGSSTWTKSFVAGYTDPGAAFFNNFTIQQVGTLDELISPLISFPGSDSSVLSFRVAAAVRDNTNVSVWDGLEVYVSGDGGITYNRAYKKTGIFLKTIEPVQTGSFLATPDQPERWRLETVNLSPYIIPGQQMIIKFRNTNAHGNNTYLDDISVTASTIPTLDAAAIALTNVPPVLCDGSSIAPILSFHNDGKDSITSLNINYKLDNGPVTAIAWTGLLTKAQTAQQALNTIAGILPGAHVLTVFTSLPNGLADQHTQNDTLKINLVALSPVQPPVAESFENTAFPPANWAVAPSNKTYTWERTTRAATEGVASAWIRNYRLNGNGATDDLYAPLVQLSAPDSVFLTFDLAHVNSTRSGSSATQLDTLEVLLTRDCGVSFTSVYKKWGADFQTSGDPNTPIVYPASDTVGFVPATKSQWRKDSVDLTRLLGGVTGSFQLVFRNSNNYGNNTYLDNVNIRSLILPAALKSRGYLITPNPSNGIITIRHYPQPVGLKGILIVNPAGQVIVKQAYSGNALSTMSFNLTRYSSGMYTVRMIYDNKTVTQRIIKIN